MFWLKWYYNKLLGNLGLGRLNSSELVGVDSGKPFHLQALILITYVKRWGLRGY